MIKWYWHTTCLWFIALFALMRGLMVLVLYPKLINAFVQIGWREGLTMHALCAISARLYPDAHAIIDEQGALTYRELNERVQALAQRFCLLSHDEKNLRIGILCRNHRGFVQALLAGARVGADLILLHCDSPKAQLQHVLSKHPVDVLVLDDEFQAVLAQTDFQGIQLTAWGASADDAYAIDAWVQYDPNHQPKLPRARHQGRLTVLTSGTSGQPKGVARRPSLIATLAPFITLLTTLPVRTRAVCMVSVPLFHGFGLAGLLMGLGLGNTVLLTRRFDATNTWAQLRTCSVNIWVAVPVMLKRVLERSALEPLARIPHLNAVVTGSAPLPASIAQRWMQTFGANLYNLYGTTEVAFSTIATPEQLMRTPDTVGRAALGVMLRILDMHGKPLPIGQIGRVCVGGLLVFDGYWSDKHAMYGLFDTGDLGFMDEYDCLHLYGRTDNMLVLNGENIYPIEIEQWILKHPAVLDAAVLLCIDATQESYLKALIVTDLKRYADELIVEIRADLAQHIARYKIPKVFCVVDEIPKNVLGKVDKKQAAAIVAD